MITIPFLEYTCVLDYRQYTNERTALRLCEAMVIPAAKPYLVPGEVVATATLNLPNYELPDDCVIIKDYSENAGVYLALKEAGIISEAITLVRSGFIYAPVCKLLVTKEQYHEKD